MFHPGTQRLIGLWSALPSRGGAPARTDLDPAALGSLLSQTFLLDRQGDAAVVRLAGDRIERLHGRPLRGEAWLDLWTPDSRALVAAAGIQAAREGRAVVVIAECGPAFPFEITLAPLRGPDGATDRLLGLHQPLRPGAEEAAPVSALTAYAAIGVGDIRRAPLHLAAVAGRRVA